MSPPPATGCAKGRMIVITGPSGTGKTSICNALLDRLPDATWSVSATTRQKRANEIDGQNYRFITQDQFDAMCSRGEFLETAKYVGHWYGTPLQPVKDAVEAGKYVVLEIDVQGGIQIARKMPDSIRIFVLPPTRESLVARLEGRKTESQEQLRLRLSEADGEIGAACDSGCYPYFVINDVLEETVKEVISIIDKETQES